MQKSVNPFVATLVIAFFSSLLFLYIWASQESIKLDRFGLAKTVGDNHFVVQYGNRLLWIDKQF
ncbi:MAG TPA: hypothetical protein VL995_12200 [Cellvibrio sp.]|nr:hypothetical protein [Cellvibrio sp.]